MADPGHLFVVRGDLTRIHCDARLIPTDRDANLTYSWHSVVAPEDLEPSARPGSKRYRPSVGQALPFAVGHGTWLFDAATYGGDEVSDVVGRAVDAVAHVSRALTSDRRHRPVIALPLAGTGHGGLRGRRGAVVEQLVSALTEIVSSEGHPDVALVLSDDRDVAAVQHERRNSTWQLPDTLREAADGLGRLTVDGAISLFLGAGVSVPLNLHTWQQLVEELENAAGSRPTTASLEERADQALSTQTGRARFDALLKDYVVDDYSLGHALLAELDIRQVVTTNFDTAYEAAVAGRDLLPRKEAPLRVMTRMATVSGAPWLLKIHGDAATPKHVVLSKTHFADLARSEGRGGTLRGLVQALLLTSHAVFVGYSREDETYALLVKAVDEILLESTEQTRTVGTVLAIHEGPVAAAAHSLAGLDVFAMPVAETEQSRGARLLEIFLDRMTWRVDTARATSSSFLLDDRYEQLVADGPAHDVHLALSALAEATSEADDGSAEWDTVRRVLTDFGWTEKHPPA